MSDIHFLENVVFACQVVINNAERGNIIIDDVSLHEVKDTLQEAKITLEELQK